MTSFGERLKQLMEDQSISQRDLAAALNISKSTVSGYVNSYREPDFKSLLEIASIFHVTTDYLPKYVFSLDEFSSHLCP